MKTLKNLYKRIMAKVNKFIKDHIIDEVHPDDPNF
jgi:hypothetical protein